MRNTLIIVIAGATLFVAFTFYIFLQSPIQADSVPVVAKVSDLYEQKKENLPMPVRLKIPKINEDAKIEYVGLGPDGAMDVPKTPNDVAWFNLSSIPGDDGTSIIAGHSGWKNDIPAVFDNLHKLQKGDKIFIEDENGKSTTFVVTKVWLYEKDEDVFSIFGSTDRGAHLNLITCAGAWSESEKSSSKRLVVYTDKVVSE